jgi:putative flippase GtrA
MTPSPPSTPSWRAGLWRYALVGGISTAAHYALLALCVEAGWLAAAPASGLGAMLGAQIAFLGNRWFTFRHAGGLARAWWRFQTIALLGAVANMAVVGSGVSLGLHYLLAQVLATVAVMVLTYQLNRVWTFQQPE